jgi:hypothetical protein
MDEQGNLTHKRTIEVQATQPTQPDGPQATNPTQDG